MSAWGRAEAAERTAEALLRTHGFRVRLRVPGLASSGDDAEQLGLATPAFEDVELGRGVFRKTSSTRALLLGARDVERALAARGALSAEAMFAEAAGVVIGEALYRIEAHEALRAGDGVYGYGLTLAPVG